MSPTPNDFSKKIGRELQSGGILVLDNNQVRGISQYYEIIETGFKVKPSILDKVTNKKDIDGIVVREITSFGPAEKTMIFAMSGGGALDFDNIIRFENRTDEPSLRER